eukprot:6670826-Pyramimonas_sp.AAC.1
MFTDTARRSLTLSFMLEGGKQGPAYAVNAAPLVEWAKAVWTKRIPTHILQGALGRAEATQRNKLHPWSAVVGPAGAMLATARRIGWQMVSAS